MDNRRNDRFLAHPGGEACRTVTTCCAITHRDASTSICHRAAIWRLAFAPPALRLVRPLWRSVRIVDIDELLQSGTALAGPAGFYGFRDFFHERVVDADVGKDRAAYRDTTTGASGGPQERVAGAKGRNTMPASSLAR